MKKAENADIAMSVNRNWQFLPVRGSGKVSKMARRLVIRLSAVISTDFCYTATRSKVQVVTRMFLYVFHFTDGITDDFLPSESVIMRVAVP